jgi:hypothetical protein
MFSILSDDRGAKRKTKANESQNNLKGGERSYPRTNINTIRLTRFIMITNSSKDFSDNPILPSLRSVIGCILEEERGSSTVPESSFQHCPRHFLGRVYLRCCVVPSVEKTI